MEKSFKNYVLVTINSNTQRQKIHWPISQIPHSIKHHKNFFKKVKNLDAHRNVQVKYYSLRSAGGDFFQSHLYIKIAGAIFLFNYTFT